MDHETALNELLDKDAQTGGDGGLSKKQFTMHGMNISDSGCWDLLKAALGAPAAPGTPDWDEEQKVDGKERTNGKRGVWGEARGQWAADGPGGAGMATGHGVRRLGERGAFPSSP